MKSILLHVNEDDGMEGRLSVALDIARALGGHLTCFHVTPFSAYVNFEPFGAAVVNAALIDELRDRAETLKARIETHLRGGDVPWDWSSVDGDPARALASAAALADLVIVSQTAGRGAGVPPAIVDDVAVSVGCATLMVPAGADRLRLDEPMVVAWNGSEEAARALRQAVPLLRLGSEVAVVMVGEDSGVFAQGEAATYLARHQVKAELHTLPARGDVAATLLDFAAEKGAAALVMGAYGHSRLRETLLGGVTRSMLRDAAIPVLFGR